MFEKLEDRRLLALPNIEFVGERNEQLSIELSSNDDVLTLEYRTSFTEEDFEGIDEVARVSPSIVTQRPPYNYEQVNWRSLLQTPRADEGVWPYFFVKYNGSAFVIPEGVHTHLIAEGDSHHSSQYAGWTYGTRTKIRIEGRGGDDLIIVDPNFNNTRVSLLGQNGNDTLIGGTYIDSLFGGAGNDSIVTNARVRSHIEGNAGDDVLIGGRAQDEIEGDGGDDQLDGGDYRIGNATKDFVFKLHTPSIGNTGNRLSDSLFGDAGNDIGVRDSRDVQESIEGWVVFPF